MTKQYTWYTCDAFMPTVDRLLSYVVSRVAPNSEDKEEIDKIVQECADIYKEKDVTKGQALLTSSLLFMASLQDLELSEALVERLQTHEPKKKENEVPPFLDLLQRMEREMEREEEDDN